ncbi:MAG TPA: hypothetical protein VIZ30_12145 [Pseudomonadales bacterium]
MIVRVLFIVLCVALAASAKSATLFADKTDRELTELAAGWEALSEAERRALLTEIKARMHTNSGKVPVLTIKTERRYGRIVRQPDGSLVRIETTEHVVRYQPLPEDAADRAFGVGFEQRSGAPATELGKAEVDPVSPPSQPPVMHVGNAKHR